MDVTKSSAKKNRNGSERQKQVEGWRTVTDEGEGREWTDGRMDGGVKKKTGKRSPDRRVGWRPTADVGRRRWMPTAGIQGRTAGVGGGVRRFSFLLFTATEGVAVGSAGIRRRSRRSGGRTDGQGAPNEWPRRRWWSHGEVGPTPHAPYRRAPGARCGSPRPAPFRGLPGALPSQAGAMNCKTIQPTTTARRKKGGNECTFVPSSAREKNQHSSIIQEILIK